MIQLRFRCALGVFVKTVNDIWQDLSKNEVNKGETLKAACRELCVLSGIGVLPEGIVRQFAKRLASEGFGDSSLTFSVAKGYLEFLAVQTIAESA